ncbi:hypothetical protein ACFWDQ_17215 [Streptomyces sp. NPDC060053]|uniref:hypothetical protein n=1 Tax=Streptomyces sp. NPDC060053 TaxID=3347047 RepID=UPI003698099F
MTSSRAPHAAGVVLVSFRLWGEDDVPPPPDEQAESVSRVDRAVTARAVLGACMVVLLRRDDGSADGSFGVGERGVRVGQPVGGVETVTVSRDGVAPPVARVWVLGFGTRVVQGFSSLPEHGRYMG